MRHVELTDVIVATVLPFDEQGGIDWDSYRRLLDYCATPDGIGAVFVNGHAGEGAALTREERIRGSSRRRGTTSALRGCSSRGSSRTAREKPSSRPATRRRTGPTWPSCFPSRASPREAPARRPPVTYVRTVVEEAGVPVSIFQYPPGLRLRLSDGDPDADRRAAGRRRHQGGQRHDDRIRGQLPAPQSRGSAASPCSPRTSTGFSPSARWGRTGSCRGSRTSPLTSWWTSGGRRRPLTSARMRDAADRLHPIVRTIYGAPPRMDMHTRIKAGLEHLGVIDCAMPRAPLLPISDDLPRTSHGPWTRPASPASFRLRCTGSPPRSRSGRLRVPV